MRLISVKVVFLFLLFLSSLFLVNYCKEISEDDKSIMESIPNWVKSVEKYVIAGLNIFQDYAAKETRQKVKDVYEECKTDYKNILNNIKKVKRDIVKKKFKDAEIQVKQAISSAEDCSNGLKKVSDESPEKVKRISALVVEILEYLLKKIMKLE